MDLVAGQGATPGSAPAVRPAGGGDCADVVSVICGAHAQVMSAAELSIALRCKDVTRSEVRRALSPGGTLVKTFGPRGTVHLLAAADLPMWTGALSAVPSSVSGRVGCAGRLPDDAGADRRGRHRDRAGAGRR